MYYLIKFEASWADEIDCQQFEIVNCKDPYRYLKDMLDEQEYFSIGSNEQFEPGEITLEDFEVRPMTENDYKVFCKYFLVPFAFGVGIL